jgi:hypothetical protein
VQVSAKTVCKRVCIETDISARTFVASGQEHEECWFGRCLSCSPAL